MKETWRDNVESYLKKHLELQILEAAKHSEAYNKSQNPSNAQLWVAVANLSKQLFETNLRIKFMEKTLSDLVNKQISEDFSRTKAVKRKK